MVTNRESCSGGILLKYPGRIGEVGSTYSLETCALKFILLLFSNKIRLPSTEQVYGLAHLGDHTLG